MFKAFLPTQRHLKPKWLLFSITLFIHIPSQTHLLWPASLDPSYTSISKVTFGVLSSQSIKILIITKACCSPFITCLMYARHNELWISQSAVSKTLLNVSLWSIWQQSSIMRHTQSRHRLLWLKVYLCWYLVKNRYFELAEEEAVSLFLQRLE